MVAAAKLRRAQEAAEAARPYAERMEAVLGNLAAGVAASTSAPRLLGGTGSDQTHLLVVATSERGLCGGFNSSIVRLARATVDAAARRGQDRQDPRPSARRAASSCAATSAPSWSATSTCRRRASSATPTPRTSPHDVMHRFDAGEFDVCTDLLQPLPVGDQPDPDRAAADPGGVRGRRGRPAGAPRTNTSPTRRRSSPTCCRAASPPRSSPRCSRTAASEQGARMTRHGQRHPQRRRHDRPADHQSTTGRARRRSPRN